jgi:serine/threonine protein kinase
MPSPDSSRDALLEQLAEEFVERHRRGERPPLSEYADRHPDLAAEIGDLFPALVQIERLKPAAGDLTGAFVPESGRADGHTPERLGEYRILRQVGSGGMGVVYEAEQESLGRHVALKVLPRQALLKATYRERFRREAKAAAKLHHTNIVPVFGVGECDGTHYYAMQFIRGEGLDKVLRDLRLLRAAPGVPPTVVDPFEGSVAQGLLTGRFAAPAAAPAEEPPARSSPSLPTAADGAHGSSTLSAGGAEGDYFRGIGRVAVQVADALAYAHRQGILHRDIKPSNLLLDQQGTVWITDFGLAKAEGADDLTQVGDIVGTLRYMAPERFEGRSLPQSDVYALGVTLYELLTLRPAFDNTNRARLVDQVLHEPPVPPRKLDPRIPRDLETVVLRCLAKDPAERYTSAEVLAEDVRRFLADRPILARRSSLAERTWRWCRRNPAVAALTALMVTMLVAVAVGSTVTAVRIAADGRALANARDEADRNAAGVEQARQKEAGQRKRAEEIAAESRQRLARLCLANGERLRDDGDGLGALVWFAEALKDDAADRRREDTHRVRLATALRHSPRLLQFWTFDQPVYHVEFSPDGRSLAVTSGNLHYVAPARGEARVYDTVTGKEVFPTLKHPVPVYHASFSPDGRRLVTAWGGNVEAGPRMMRGAGGARVWDARTGKPLTRALEHETWVRQATFSPDGRHLITLYGAYNTFSGAQVWDLATGKPAGPAVKPNRVYHLALDPSVQRLAVGSWMDAQILDLFTGAPLTPLLKHGLKEIGKGARRGIVNHVAFSPDGRRVVTASGDDTARVWDAVTGQLGRRHRPGGDPAVEAQRQGQPRGLQPGRQVGPHRQRRRDGPRLGRRHGGPGHPAAQAQRPRHLRGLQPRRQAAGHRERRPAGAGLGHGRLPDGAGVGRRHGPSGEPDFPARRPGDAGGVQPGRPAAGDGRPGRRRPPVGPGEGGTGQPVLRARRLDEPCRGQPRRPAGARQGRRGHGRRVGPGRGQAGPVDPQAQRLRQLPGVQPGRAPGADGQRGEPVRPLPAWGGAGQVHGRPAGPGLGLQDRKAARRTAAARETRVPRRVQPRRQPGGHGQRRQDGTGVERRDGRARDAALAARRPGGLRRVQPGRAARGHVQLGRDGPGVGRGHRRTGRAGVEARPVA